MTPQQLDTYIKEAREFAKNSHDSETQVGSVLVNTKGEVIQKSYNGFVRGAQDHKLPTTRPDKHLYMQHSERNLVYNSIRHQTSMKDCFVVCTLSPCPDCIRALWQCEIDTIYFEDHHKSLADILAMKDLRITLTNIGKYSKITIQPRKD